MRRLRSALVSLAFGAVVFAGGLLLGDARGGGDPELVLPPAEPATSVASAEGSAAAALAPADPGELGDVPRDELAADPGPSGEHQVVESPVSGERAAMLDPERLAAEAEDGAEPYEPPTDAVAEDELRAELGTGVGASGGGGEAAGALGPAEPDDGMTTRFFDLCAGDGSSGEPEEGEDCPDEGFGGFVLFPLVDISVEQEPFSWYLYSLNLPSWVTRCPIEPVDYRTQAVFWHTTNRPADRVTVRYQPNVPGIGDRFQRVEAVPAPGELERFARRGADVDPSRDAADQVHYCTVLTGLDPDVDSIYVEVDHEVGGQEVRPLHAVTTRRRGGAHDGYLQMNPLGDHALASVLHEEDQRVWMGLLPRTGPGATQDRCASIKDAVLARRYRGPSGLGTPRLVELATPVQPSSISPTYTHETSVAVWPEEGVTYTLCAWVVGTDQFGVTGPFQEDEIQFTAPNRSRIRVELLHVEATVELDAGDIEASVAWPLTVPALLPPDDLGAGEDKRVSPPVPLFDSGARPIPRVTTVTLRAPGGSTTAVELPTPTNLCPAAPEGGDERDVICVGGYHREHRLPLPGRGGEPVGWATVRVEAYDGPGAEHRVVGDDRDWAIGPTGSHDPRVPGEGPIRLRGGTRLTFDEADPTRAEVRLEADREIVVDAVGLDVVAVDEGGCDTPVQTSPDPDRDHVHRFQGLCPGTSYRVEYTVREPDGEPQSGVFGLITTPGHDIDYFQPFARLRPAPGVTSTSMHQIQVIFNGMSSPIGAPYCSSGDELREFTGHRSAYLPSALELPRLVPVGIVVRPHPDATCDPVRPRAVMLALVPATDLLAGDVTISVPVDGWGTLDVRLTVGGRPQLGEPPVLPEG